MVDSNLSSFFNTCIHFDIPCVKFCSKTFTFSFRRTGTLRTAGAMRTSARHNPARSKRKPPRGMHLNYDDLVAIVTGPSGEGDTILRSMDSEIVSFKRQVIIFKLSVNFLKILYIHMYTIQGVHS